MPREPHIPLFLWIATAFLVHISGYKGADQVSEVLGDRLEVQRFADEVRRHVLSANRQMEVALVDEQDLPPPPEKAKPDETEQNDEAGPPEETPPTKVQPNPVKPKEEPHPKPIEEPKKPEEKLDKPKPEKPKEPEQKKDEQAPKQDFPAMKVPNRI